MVKYQKPDTNLIFQTDYVDVLFREPDSLLIINWKRQITFSERKDTFLWAYDYSVANKVKNWLIDDEALFIITVEEKDWVTHEWTKLVAGSEIEKIAVLIAGTFPNQHSNVEFTEAAIEQYERFGRTRHEVFTDLPIALAWLKDELE